MQIKREDFLKELNEEIQLREYVRNTIRLMKERNKKEDESVLNENKKLRSVIQTLLSEVKVQNPEEAPHDSTGINFLRALLKRILPGALEDDYKALTTDKSQRDSFRAHIINAVQDALAPQRVTDNAGEISAITEAEDIDITIEDSDGMPGEFIDIEKSEPKPTEDVEKEEFGLGGEEETGRDAAYDTFKRVEPDIVKTWGKLYTDEDKELFYDYLITNLKMHFDRFEKELQETLPEPTTPEYEEETAAAETEEMGAQEEMPL